MEAEVYSPREDTLLLADAARAYRGFALEIGIGSGHAALGYAKAGGRLVGTDISISALRRSKELLASEGLENRLDLIACDSASAFRDHSFELVYFNPPYLPSKDIHDPTVDGGRGGAQVTEAWLADALRVLGENGTIVFVLSSLTKSSRRITSRLRGQGFDVRRVAGRRLFFEELKVFEATRRGSRGHRRPRLGSSFRP